MQNGLSAYGFVILIADTPMGLRAINQLRENVRELLRRRGENQNSLAFALRRHPTTINKFLMGKREVQMADLDGMADFFGLPIYQLFQPGISRLTERRMVARRREADRRIGHDQRNMAELAAERDAHHPHRKGGPHVVSASSLATELRRAAADHARLVDRLISEAQSGRQAPPPSAAVAKSRKGGRAVGGSDAEKA